MAEIGRMCYANSDKRELLGSEGTCVESRRVRRNRTKLEVSCRNIKSRKQCVKALKTKFLPKTEVEPCPGLTLIFF